ncbi:MAG: hypothetical protein Q9162_005625 [Coniocarpon cinnabarinum]
MSSKPRSILHRRKPSIDLAIKPPPLAAPTPKPMAASIANPTNEGTKFHPEAVTGGTATTKEIFAAHYPAYKLRVPGAAASFNTVLPEDVTKKDSRTTTSAGSDPGKTVTAEPESLSIADRLRGALKNQTGFNNRGTAR